MRRALGRAYADVADLIDEIGSIPEALAAHGKALEVRRALAREAPADPSADADLGRSLPEVGILLYSSGRYDEALTLDRTHGRGPSGVRVDGPVPHGHWKVVTLTSAACLAFDGATDSAAVATYVAGCLAPTLRPGEIVILDDLPRHKRAEVARLIARAGAEVWSLPASGPDRNPMERLLCKLKAWLRAGAASRER